MLAFFSFFYLIFIAFSDSDIYTRRKKLFCMALLLNVFFFSSYDYIFKIQLYVFPMLLSIAFSFFQKIAVKKKNLILFFSIAVYLLIPIIYLMIVEIDDMFLLIQKSTSSTMDIYTQLHKPEFDINVVKHYVYFVLYLFFLVCNADLISDKYFCDDLLKKFLFLFKLLFLCIIFEWAIVNIGHFNDREIMQKIFSIGNLNMKTNWHSWGSYNVALCFTERSEMSITIFFYFLMLKEKSFSKSDYMWIFMSIFAIYCTGSSTALLCLTLFVLSEFVILMLYGGNVKQVTFIMFVSIIGISIIYFNKEIFLSKIVDFITFTDDAGSAHYRMQSILIGLRAVLEYPFFGVGIGTVYVNSMLVETLANIGLIGVILTLKMHYSICRFTNNLKNMLIILSFFVLSIGAFMVQNFTSPMIIVLFIILRSSGSIYEKNKINILKEVKA